MIDVLAVFDLSPLTLWTSFSFFSIFIYCAETSDLKPSQDFVGEPGIRPGSQTKSVGSGRVSDKSADFI